MGYLENFTLEDTISAYEKTMEVTGDNGEHCYSPIDDITLNFLKELKAYRDAEEQGLLIKLPCSIGTTVYIVGSKYRCGREEYWINTGKFRLSDLDKIGKTVFLTKEEAEKKLAEYKGE